MLLFYTRGRYPAPVFGITPCKKRAGTMDYLKIITQGLDIHTSKSSNKSLALRLLSKNGALWQRLFGPDVVLNQRLFC
jgi:hypothetical protein